MAVEGCDASDQKGEQKDGDLGGANMAAAGCCRLAIHLGNERTDEWAMGLLRVWVLRLIAVALVAVIPSDSKRVG